MRRRASCMWSAPRACQMRALPSALGDREPRFLVSARDACSRRAPWACRYAYFQSALAIAIVMFEFWQKADVSRRRRERLYGDRCARGGGVMFPAVMTSMAAAAHFHVHGCPGWTRSPGHLWGSPATTTRQVGARGRLRGDLVDFLDDTWRERAASSVSIILHLQSRATPAHACSTATTAARAATSSVRRPRACRQTT